MADAPATAGEGPSQAPVVLPLCDIRALTTGRPESAGARWRLAESGRQLDANVVQLPPGGRIATHREPDLDVLFLVIAGSGVLESPGPPRPQPLTEGVLFWLPHGSARSIAAGPDGLSWLTVHRRRPGMVIQPHPPGEVAGPDTH